MNVLRARNFARVLICRILLIIMSIKVIVEKQFANIANCAIICYICIIKEQMHECRI